MIEITKRVYTIDNEELNFYCSELNAEVEICNINGQIIHEVGCGYEADIDVDCMEVYVTDKDGNDLTKNIYDIEAFKEELAENMIVEYDNLMIDADECKILKDFLRD